MQLNCIFKTSIALVLAGLGVKLSGLKAKQPISEDS